MRISVVISTYNRVQSLRTTLDALRYQRHRDFEVVVVNGPSDDGTAELLAERAGELRVVEYPERRLSVSRNLGIDAAAGEVVAFIDDDAVPEPRWLADLAAAYDDPAVGGAGGLTLDATGVRAQYRHALCDRIGRTDYDTPPGPEATAPGADPFLYLQGTNCSFRRSALEQAGGFDEHIEYTYDDVEICARVIDCGFALRQLDGAVVHHHQLPSSVRRDPQRPMKDRAYFALRMGAGHRSRGEAFAALAAVLVREDDERAHAGFAAGVELGLAGARGDHAVAPADPSAFKPYPAREPGEAVCFVAPDPEARRLAGTGAEVHVLQPGGNDHRIAFEDGVWVHRFPPAAPLRGAYDRAVARFAFDRVIGALPPRTTEPFPFDVEGDVQRALRQTDPEAIVADLYQALLRRPATPDEIGIAVPRLLADERGFVREMATGDEARALEHDLAFLERLPERPYAELLREQTAARLLEAENEIRAALEAAADEAFVETAFRLLLDREPDPSADGLRPLGRPVITWIVGTSEEATERGVPPELVRRLVGALADRRLLRLRRR